MTLRVVAEPATGTELDRLWADPRGLRGQLTGVQNDKTGTRLLLRHRRHDISRPDLYLRDVVPRPDGRSSGCRP